MPKKVIKRVKKLVPKMVEEEKEFEGEEITASEPAPEVGETTGTEVPSSLHKLELETELVRLRKLHSDQVTLGINPDSKLEVLITNLDNEIKRL